MASTGRFEMRGRTINDRSIDMDRIDQVVQVDTTEIWQVTNADGSYTIFLQPGAMARC